jgi:hypothetical protein
MRPDPFSHTSTLDTSGTSAGESAQTASMGPVLGQQDEDRAGRPAPDDEHKDPEGTSR